MAHDRFEWIDRLKFVEREHRVVATAIAQLRRAILDGWIRTPVGTTPRDTLTRSFTSALTRQRPLDSSMPVAA
jgi:hypothetical protein